MYQSFLVAISSLPPGGRYVVNHSGSTLTDAPLWAILISAGAAVLIVSLTVKGQLEARRHKQDQGMGA